MQKQHIGILVAIVAVAVVAFVVSRMKPPASTDVVTVYAALDEEFSAPILDRFERETGIRVDVKFDTESTKTVGLTAAIVEEASRPRCDVFWNNEPVNTIRLKEKGLLQAYRPEAAARFPEAFKDPDGMWTGFAARARVLLVNTDLVEPGEEPRVFADLLEEKWKGKLIMAKPTAGSTATWVTVFYVKDKEAPEDETTHLDLLARLLKDGHMIARGGNKQSAQAVSRGDMAMGWTDTDDAIVEVEAGKPVKILYLGATPEDGGALFFPNTLSIVKNCPHPENARKLIEYLLSAKVEKRLADSASAQIPVNPAIQPGEDFKPRVTLPSQSLPMVVDWDKVAAHWDEAMAWIDRNVP